MKHNLVITYEVELIPCTDDFSDISDVGKYYYYRCIRILTHIHTHTYTQAYIYIMYIYLHAYSHPEHRS